MSHVSAHRSVCYSWDFIRVLSVTLFKPLIETSYREDRAEGQAPGSLSEASLWVTRVCYFTFASPVTHRAMSLPDSATF